MEMSLSLRIQSRNDCSAEGFELVNLDDDDISGHGYARRPCREMIRSINELGSKYKLEKNIDNLLNEPRCDIGPTDGDVPDKCDFVVVGAGIMGVFATADAAQNGFDTICIERDDKIGGIWYYYANQFSQVNTSEIGYRLVTQTGPTSRPNKDHSPKHDILRDIFTVAAKAKGSFRCRKDVTKIDKNQDGTYTVHGTDLYSGLTFKVVAKSVCFAVNRRIGKRRDVVYPGEERFRGQLRYGYANEVLGLDFWGKRTIVVGAGAFAFENLRTSLEHGSRHSTILGRRAGTTCPKWIDIIAFIRPIPEKPEHIGPNRAASAMSFECWRQCYTDANLPTPECWDEGLLKPHNHTVSVSDIAFIGGHHGMVDLDVGEIKCIHPAGDRVIYHDGKERYADIIIKATGFHLNMDVAKMCGVKEMFPWGQMDFNLFYQAEPLLDGGQFGSAKGRMTDSGKGEVEDIAALYKKGSKKFRELDLPDILATRNTNFGSGYMGFVLTNVFFQTWLLQNPDQQKAAYDWAGAPPTPADMFWASAVGGDMQRITQRVVKSIVEADTAECKQLRKSQGSIKGQGQLSIQHRGFETS